MNVIKGRFSTGGTRHASRKGSLFGLMYVGILRRWEHDRAACEYAAAQYVQELRAGHRNDEAWHLLQQDVAMLLLTHSSDQSRRFYEDMRTRIEAAALR